MKRTAAQNPAEHPFPGHDAVAHGLIDSAAVMTFLSDLGQFQKYLAALKAGAQRQAARVKTFYNEIFAERAILDFGTLCAEFLDFFPTQQAHLPVPVTGVSVASDAEVAYKLCF
ncbi:hypothetical protein SDC9_68944 [bioreactor metagenome]|uniref:Uncharacterized protein n=1 Tax=bioreactor metagenome TaxID=1076179 RepID=A0A644Y2A9_9ZZZZ